MKGLALILGGMKKGPPMGKKPPMGGPPSHTEPDADEVGGPPDADADDAAKPADGALGGGGSEMKYARLASEAIADGDHDAAADALVSMVKACMSSYGGE